MTFGDKNAPENPCFWCDSCYRPFHYSEEGRLLYDDFQVINISNSNQRFFPTTMSDDSKSFCTRKKLHSKWKTRSVEIESKFEFKQSISEILSLKFVR